MSHPAEDKGTLLLTLSIQQEHDVVQARQSARQIASFLRLPQQDQVRVATAVSEMARNAYQYARGGQVEFSMNFAERPPLLWIKVSDNGPGIKDLEAVLAGQYESPTGMGIGLAGSRRLMDEFSIQSDRGAGVTVWLGKRAPLNDAVEPETVKRLCRVMPQQIALGPTQEVEQQGRELMSALSALHARESELLKREHELARLSLELEETNRGVVALYAELDDKAAALRRADEMRARFLSHVSHEFRTPVNSVLALTRLLLQHVDGDLTSEQARQVSYIRDAAQQLSDMVNDLLDLAKVDAGKTELRFTHIDIGQFFGAIRALMRPLATLETVKLIFEEPPAGLFIESDEGKLAQIIRNLISNALKFTQAGEVRVSASAPGNTSAVQFTVADSGIGIASEDQDRIFQEFAQIDNPIQRSVKGTGLGLPLSRRLAALLGGSLTVESKLGVGSTFTLALPRYPAGSPGQSRLSGLGSADKFNRQSILVIDDDPMARYLIGQLFRGSRYEVVESCGAEAAERARFDLPALIVLDLVMPDRSGFDVLSDLKSDDATKDIPVVIHTSKPLKDADFALLGYKQLAVLPKGVDRRLPALLAMRAVLSDESLFAAEPEFQ